MCLINTLLKQEKAMLVLEETSRQIGAVCRLLREMFNAGLSSAARLTARKAASEG